ncbi:MAG: oxidoreductase [Thermoleophilia bacterium]|nr:oxidoreductase [Thermoleophilia bacterium]
MFVLLKNLQQLRRTIGLPAPPKPGSLALRHVDCGSCNGCEHELNNIAGPHYDLDRYGFSIVASPRHADILLITGTVTTRMAGPLRAAFAAMPEPRLVAALGNCALGEGVIGDPTELVGPVEDLLPVDIRVPGCPPTPAVIAEALLGGLDAIRQPRTEGDV